jgi:hypothetical protein
MTPYSLVVRYQIWGSLLPSSSVEECSALKMEEAVFSETLVTIYQISPRRISEDATVAWHLTKGLRFKDGA